MSFVHLRCHSEYSLLDSTIHIKPLIERVKEFDQPAIALTDHNVLYGAVEFYKNANNAGIKPIIGIELCLKQTTDFQEKTEYGKRVFHILLLAKDNRGYKNLVDLTTIANVSSEGCWITKADLANHSQGLISTTGCLDSEIPYQILTGCDSTTLKNTISWYYELFGKENFFFELQDHDSKEFDVVNNGLQGLKGYFNSSYIATNDVHYLNRNDAGTYELLKQIKDQKKISFKELQQKSIGTFYLRNTEEMESIFGAIPGALGNTLQIAEMCSIQDESQGQPVLSFRGYQMPNLTLPENTDPDTFLKSVCRAGLQAQLGENISPEMMKQLDHEFEIISKMGWSSLFLIMWDLCQFAKANDLWWTLRGSANSSLIAYACGISHVNPIDHKLVFERFLNINRISMPDFDFDFTADGIVKIVNYITEKYGSQSVARIAAFGIFGARDAIRETGNVLGIPKPIIEKVVTFIPKISGLRSSINKSLETDSKFQKYYRSHSQVKTLIDTSLPLESLLRSLTIHSCGIIIGNKINNLPLSRLPKRVENVMTGVMTQFEMDAIESLGYLKQDFINQPILSVMQNTCKSIKEHYGIDYNLDNIPIDDHLAFELLNKGETAGLFQVTGKGMRRWLMHVQPSNINHISDVIALYRPGPMAFLPDYVARKRGDVEVEYRHPDLVPFFDDTFGIPVYQEQLMQATLKMAGVQPDSEDESIGYTPSMADELRKSISRKQKEQLMMHEENFISAAIYNGYRPSIAAAIYDDWREFARYGFLKAYAIDCARIVAQNAFLKANYPEEYMATVISERIVLEKPGSYYVSTAKRMGLLIHPPDVNVSDVNCFVEYRPQAIGSKSIRLGLATVKHLGRKTARQLIKERQHSGTFTGLANFLERCEFITNKLSIQALYEAGALDCLLELESKDDIDTFIESLRMLEGL